MINDCGQGEFDTPADAIPIPTSPKVANASPAKQALFNPGALTEDDIASPPAAIVVARPSPTPITNDAAKKLSGVAETDKYRIWMPRDYGIRSAWHQAGIVHASVSAAHLLIVLRFTDTVVARVPSSSTISIASAVPTGASRVMGCQERSVGNVIATGNSVAITVSWSLLVCRLSLTSSLCSKTHQTTDCRCPCRRDRHQE